MIAVKKKALGVERFGPLCPAFVGLAGLAAVACWPTPSLAQSTPTAPQSSPLVAPEQATPSSQSPAQQASPDGQGQAVPAQTPPTASTGGAAPPGQTGRVAASATAKPRYYKGRGPGRNNAYFDRNEDNFSYLIDSSKKKDWADNLKHINLTDSGSVYLTLNGEARYRGDYVQYKNLRVAAARTAAGTYTFGSFNHNQQINLTRVELGAALNVDDWLTVYAEAIDGQEFGHNIGLVKPGVQDADLTFTQAYAELRNVRAPTHYGVRIGRQYIYLGNGLQIAPNYSTDFPIPTYDSVRGYIDGGTWRVDGFYGDIIAYQNGVLKSRTDHGNTNWGAYGSLDLAPFHLGGADAKLTVESFWIGFRGKPSPALNRDAYYDRVFVTGNIGSAPYAGILPPTNDLRQTFGLREFGSVGKLDFDWQGAFQVGSYRDYAVRAFAINTETGYTLPGQWKPRLAVRANVASGGADARHRTIATYNPLQSALFYYAENTVISPTNLWNLAPRFTFQPAKNLNILVYDGFFWRYSGNDALYSGIWQGGGGPNQFATTIYNRRSFVGQQPALKADYAFNSHLSFTAIAADFLVGPALKEAGAKNTFYLRFIADLKF